MERDKYPQMVDVVNNTTHRLSGRIVTIGSAKECHIQLTDTDLPPLAAHILYIRGSYHLQRLSPGTSIKIDGQILNEQLPLKHGMHILIGKSDFIYAESDELEPALTANMLPNNFNDNTFLGELITIVISLLRNKADKIVDDLVNAVAHLLRADASRLVQENGVTGERLTVSRYPQETGLDRFSDHAIDWAKEESRTILLHDSEWKETRRSFGSLEKNLVSSVLCAPLRYEGAIFGYLYLDRLQSSNLFTETDRRLCDIVVPLFSEILRNQIEYKRQCETIERLQKECLITSGNMIYESKQMKETIQLAIKFARTESSVLILGETGTGKELMARFIHDQSSRKGRPFKAINCGAIQENLIESELFGHEKGAFTGAISQKTGIFEAAQGGTLLLDEIGELPLLLQVKLLRVLQESEITRVGSNETISVDVRIIAATNKNLVQEIEAGNFRQDLYFRLNVLTIPLTALRDRAQDVLLLAEYFIHRSCEQYGLAHKRLSATASNALLHYGWPGNIRELENVIQRACLMSDDAIINEKNFFLKNGAHSEESVLTSQNHTTLKEVRANAEKEIINQTLLKTNGNISQAAKLLDIDRKWLMKKMGEFDISADTYR
ncbi:MAG: sigma 54-interacting transcriptional regulator [Chitinivibrionales bacterium]|nr:sigma 54-interacting transcriptional regulator [Chitinivibrionales bacterium]